MEERLYRELQEHEEERRRIDYELEEERKRSEEMERLAQIEHDRNFYFSRNSTQNESFGWSSQNSFGQDRHSQYSINSSQFSNDNGLLRFCKRIFAQKYEP